MIYRFIDERGTFVVEGPHKHNLYFPLTDKEGRLLCSISPNLAGDIKRDNEHFLMAPAGIEDLRSNLLSRRDFFIKTGRRGLASTSQSHSRTIRCSYPYQDRVEAGFLYHKIIKKTKSLEIEILNFVPFDTPVEIMRVTLRNKSNETIKIIPTSFIPLYGRAEKSLRDHRHVTSLLNRVYLDKFGLLLKPTMVFDEKGHKANETIYFVLGFEDEGQPPAGQFPTLDYFYGQGDAVFPDAIEKNVRPVQKKLPEFDGKESCAAFRFKEKRLKKSGEVSYFLIMGIAENEAQIRNTFKKLNSPAKIRKSFEETGKYWLGYLSGLEFDFKDRDFNNWLSWVKLQPTLRKLFGCSFLPHFDYGKGGRGWRDLWQDALTLLLTQAGEKAKKFILDNFKGVRIDGSNATIITKDGQFISDRNRITRIWMDHGIWPYLTLRLYIDKTGDLDILLKQALYFQDHQYKRAKEIDPYFPHKDYTLRDKNGKIYSGSILEHILVQSLVQFFNVGRHNIIRLESADWNDGLDMAPEHGESVTFSFMYAHNLRDLCRYLERLKEKTNQISILKELTFLLDAKRKPRYSDFEYKQKMLNEYLGKVRNASGEKVSLDINQLILDLKSKAEHLFQWLGRNEWLKEGFFNGYYDEQGKPVEGKADQAGIRMLLASQAFAIMSGVAAEKKVKKIWLSIKRHLRDKELGGFRLNTNFNSHHHLDLGRAFGFSYGDKENGAFFNHMVVMLANALYARGFVNEGFEVINSIYKMATHNRGKIYPMIPEYFNNEGRGLYLYLTGSASWYIYTLLEEILGIKFDSGDIYLEPKLTAGNFFKQEIETKFNLQGKALRVIFLRRREKNKNGGAYKIEEAYLRDKKIMPQAGRYVIKKEELHKAENIIKVYLS
jgi:cellobiose phosphorylase